MKEGIRMPGFTAEASLYKPRRHYDLGVSRSADGQVVTPQRSVHNSCYDACISYGHTSSECVAMCRVIDGSRPLRASI